ncbi:MAG: OmpA family protein [Pseudomonadota bacterium]
MKSGVVVAALSLSLSGCLTTQDAFTGDTQLRKSVAGTGLGAAAGALAGAVIGNNVGGGNARRGALIGAGLGALTGGGVGVFLDRQEAELRQQLQGTGVSVTRTPDGIILNMPSNVTFSSGADQVQPSFFPVLNSVAVVLDRFDQSIVDVLGHTDSDGDDKFNFDLSERRAANVANYLVGQGLDPRRFAAQGFGENRPVATNATPEGKALNRRVEIRISPLTAG